MAFDSDSEMQLLLRKLNYPTDSDQLVHLLKDGSIFRDVMPINRCQYIAHDARFAHIYLIDDNYVVTDVYVGLYDPGIAYGVTDECSDVLVRTMLERSLKDASIHATLESAQDKYKEIRKGYQWWSDCVLGEGCHHSGSGDAYDAYASTDDDEGEEGEQDDSPAPLTCGCGCGGTMGCFGRQ